MGRLAGCHALDQARVGLDILRPPFESVGVEKAGGQQERGALIGVRERMILDEVLQQHGGLLDPCRVCLDAPEGGKRGMQRGLGQREPWQSGDRAWSASSRYVAMSM